MKLNDILEWGSSNPFVAIVSSIDMRLRELDVAIHGGESPVFTSSLKTQVNDLLKFVVSAEQWPIPDPKLRRDFHEALPKIKHRIESCLRWIDNKGRSDLNGALVHLEGAREVAVKSSHLKFSSR